jgi:hypothetical protein
MRKVLNSHSSVDEGASVLGCDAVSICAQNQSTSCSVNMTFLVNIPPARSQLRTYSPSVESELLY